MVYEYLLRPERERYLAVLSEECPALVDSFVWEVVSGKTDPERWAAEHLMADAWLIAMVHGSLKLCRDNEKLWGRRPKDFRFQMPPTCFGFDGAGPYRLLVVRLDFQPGFGQPWAEFEKKAREAFEKELRAVKSHFSQMGLLRKTRSRINDGHLRVLARYQANLERNPDETTWKQISRTARRLELTLRPRNKRTKRK